MNEMSVNRDSLEKHDSGRESIFNSSSDNTCMGEEKKNLKLNDHSIFSCVES